MSDHRVLDFQWEGPQSLAQVLALDRKLDYGLYQIYASHLVFGANSLVYLGRAVDQNFSQRFWQHQEWLKKESSIQVHLGRLMSIDGRVLGDEQLSETDELLWGESVKAAEGLAIFWHTPPYNSSGISAYNGQKLRVRNSGDRGSLLPEYSSHWPEDIGNVRPLE